MADALWVLVPIYAFMLIPIWIALVSIVLGTIFDVLKPRQERRAVVGQRPRQHTAVRSAGA